MTPSLPTIPLRPMAAMVVVVTLLWGGNISGSGAAEATAVHSLGGGAKSSFANASQNDDRNCGMTPIKPHRRLTAYGQIYNARAHSWPWIATICVFPGPSFFSIRCPEILGVSLFLASPAHVYG